MKLGKKGLTRTTLALFFMAAVMFGIFIILTTEGPGALVSILQFSSEDQILYLHVSPPDYIPATLTVQNNQPVKLIVNGDNARGCMKTFSIPGLGITKELSRGENLIEFTPETAGEYVITCPDGTTDATLYVVDKEHTMQDMELTQRYQPFLPGDGLDMEQFPWVKKTEIYDVKDGDSITMTAEIVKAEVAGKIVPLYAYDGMVPGPVLRAPRGAKFNVEFTTNIDVETTIHWHGLRHNISFDGVAGVSQPAMLKGDSFTYELEVPDTGLHWYHPHLRDDLQQDSGLAGSILVVPEDADYWGTVNREEVLVLDDLLLNEEGNTPYGRHHTNFALMGRFGNTMLVNGQTQYELTAQKGEVIRFFIANVANARPFNISFTGAQMKVVGSDLSAYEREFFVDSVVVAPAERYVVEVYFEESGESVLQHINPSLDYDLAKVIVSKEAIGVDVSSEFMVERENRYVVSDIDGFRDELNREVDHMIVLNVDVNDPEILSHLTDRHMDKMAEGHSGMHTTEGGIEWEDGIRSINEQTTSETVVWKMFDAKTGKQNMDLDYRYRVGDVVKFRFFNDLSSVHPMQHPMHMHGQRFLVTHMDGVPNDNLVWKDTVLVPVGHQYDILVDVTNPGVWMFHCHISEHLHAGMMGTFTVEDETGFVPIPYNDMNMGPPIIHGHSEGGGH